MPSSSPSTSSPLPTSPTHTHTNNDNDMAFGTAAAQQATLRGGKGGTDDTATSATASDLATEGTRRRVDEAKQTSDQRRKQKMNQSRLNDDNDDDDEQVPRPTTTVFVASSVSTNLEDFFPPPLSPASTSAASIATAFGEDEETSDQRIARKLEAIAKKAIIQQSDSANFDNVINELKNSCSATANQQQQEDSASSAPPSLKIKLPHFSDRYRTSTPPIAVLYDKYPLGDLLRYWFLYAEPYHHLGSDYHGINTFFRLITRRKICPLLDDLEEWDSENHFAHYQMQNIAKSVYPQVTISDLAASKSSEAVPLRAFTLFGTFKHILTTDHSARIAQKNHVVPRGGLTEAASLVSIYESHWEYPNSNKYVFIVNGTAGSGKTIAALRMAHHRPKPTRSMNFRHDHTPPKDIVIYIDVDDVYAQGKPWKEFGKARLEELYRQHRLQGTRCSYSRECDDFLVRTLIETVDRLLPPSLFKQDFNTEYRLVIVLDDMDRNFALRMQTYAARNVVRTIQEKLFGPLPKASTRNSDIHDRIFRVSFIVNAPTTDEESYSWPFNPFSTTLDFKLVLPFTSDFAKCFIDKSVFDDFSTLEKQQQEASKTDKKAAENLQLVNDLCSNARCAALLFSTLNERLLEEKQRTDSAVSISMKSFDELLKSNFPKVIREYTRRCGLSKFQHPEKALLVALAISIFCVPLLPRTLQHCPLLRKSLKLVDENDDDGDDDDSKKTLYELLVETGLLLDFNYSNNHMRSCFKFNTSPAHLAMVHIIFGIPFNDEKCFLISLVAPYFAEIKRALFLEQFGYTVELGQSVKECEDAVKKKEKEPNDWQRQLTRWSYHTGDRYGVEYAFKEVLVFDSIQGKPSDVFFFRNNVCMATEDIDDEEFEQRFKQLEKELTKKSSCSSQRNSFPVIILSSAEEDTFPQVAVVGPGKVVLAHTRQLNYNYSRTTTKVVNVNADDDLDNNDDDDNDDNKSLINLLASCLCKGSTSNDKAGPTQQQSTDAQIRYVKALQRIAKKLVS